MKMDNPIDQIHDAVSSDEGFELLHMLLARGVNPNALNNRKDTPLHSAARGSDNTAVIRELIDSGANVNSTNLRGFTPLHDAVCYRNGPMVEILLQSGADINSKTPYGFTALHFAVSNEEHEFWAQVGDHFNFCSDMNIVKMLLNHADIDIDAMADNRETPLKLAVMNKETLILKFLLARGANPNIHGFSGLTALHAVLEAVRFGEFYVLLMSMANLLLSHGADLYSLDRENKTPIDLLMEGIRDEESLKCAKDFVRLVTLHRNVSQDEIVKLEKNAELAAFRRECNSEVTLMKKQNIFRKFTMHDFVLDCFNDGQFNDELSNPCLAIYKPLVDILLTGVYTVYLDVILIHISKQQLWSVFTCNAFIKKLTERFQNLNHLRYLRICINSGSVFYECMSRLEIFYLIFSGLES